MTTNEALAALAAAPGDDQPSKLNPALTRAQTIKILTASVQTGILDRTGAKRDLIERNVRRAVSDRCRHE